MKPPRPRLVPKRFRVTEVKNLGDGTASAGLSSVILTQELDALKTRLVEQKTRFKTLRLQLVTGQTEIEHTEAQLKGVRTMLGELIWD